MQKVDPLFGRLTVSIDRNLFQAHSVLNYFGLCTFKLAYSHGRWHNKNQYLLKEHQRSAKT